MAAKTFASTEEAQANYDAIAKGLLSGDPSGTKFGHNQLRLNDQGQFEAFDLRSKGGDPSALQSHANSAASALNQLVADYGLDTSKIARGTGLTNVQYDPSTGRVRDATAAYNDIYNQFLKDQVAARISGAAPAAAAPAEAAPAVAPPPPLQYGQPPAPPAAAPAGPAGPAQQFNFAPAPQGLGSLAPPPSVPHFGTAPGATPDGVPGWQAPLTAVNNLPTGPAIGGAYAQATSAGDPFMSYSPTRYRDPLTGDQAYEQMGLQLLSRYGMKGGEHNYLPNRSTYTSNDAAKRYGQGSTAVTAQDDATKVYNSLVGN